MNAGMQAMAKANAGLSAEERKARSAKAAAASAAKAKERAALAKGAAATGGDPSRSGGKATSTTEARVEPEVVHEWRVLLLTDAGSKWADVSAPGMQRACRQARKANPGAMVRGVVRKDAKLP